MISKSGGVPSLVEGTLKGDRITKQFCGAVLSALSYYDVCRAPLCDFGAIAALKSLADLNDDGFLTEDEIRLSKFRRVDSNADGYIDADELAAMRNARRAERAS